MARPSAAAASAGGLLACAVLLLVAGQSAAFFVLPFPFISIFPDIFHEGYEAPIVRICSIVKQSNGNELNMAARNDGTVALATAKPGDKTQLWWKIHEEGEKYWLVNVATNRAMASPTGRDPVQLVVFNPFNDTQLWVPTAPLNGDFYQIKPCTNGDRSLNAFRGASDGAVIGIWNDKPVTSNTLWITREVEHK